MLRLTAFLCTFLWVNITLTAQIYTEKQTRHRFAQISMGFDYQMSLGGRTTFLNQAGQLEQLDLQSLHKQRVILGGTHFWGHADFYVAVPIRSRFFQTDEQNLFYGSSIETVFKYYPWRIEHNKVRPFVGTGIVPFFFRQNSRTRDELARGASKASAGAPLFTGFTYDFKNHLLEVTLMYDYTNRKQHYITPTQQASIQTPPVYLSFAYRYMFDTTIGSEKNWESGKTQEMTERLAAAGKLNNFFIGVAPSTSSGVRIGNYNLSQRPFFKSFSSNIFADVTLGYHFHRPDMNIALNWRSFRGGQRSFGITQSVQRRSIALEWSKNLGDYHGFTPFIGPSLSYERLQFQEYVDGEQLIDAAQDKPALGVVFGWDIRPNRIQWFVLRTNLRYYPNLNLDLASGDKVAFDNIEFNFIQLVLYPERMF